VIKSALTEKVGLFQFATKRFARIPSAITIMMRSRSTPSANIYDDRW
jgi:hypothetical protein